MGKASEVGLKCGRSLRESGRTGGWAGLGTIVARKWAGPRENDREVGGAYEWAGLGRKGSGKGLRSMTG